MSLENLYILKYVLKGNVIRYIWPLNIIGIYFKESHSYHAQKSAYCSAPLFPNSRISPRFRALGIPLNKYGFLYMNSAVSVSISSSLISLYFFSFLFSFSFSFRQIIFVKYGFHVTKTTLYITTNDYEWLRQLFQR